MIDSTITLFGLIRHAPTVWNEQKRIQGQHDSNLTNHGRAMALSWGKELGKLKWDRILCSDLGRVQQTGALINRSLHIPVASDQRLREQDWGAWTGMTLAEIKEHDRSLVRDQERNGWDFKPPDGESRREVLARSVAALREFHSQHENNNVLVVCHEGVIKCLLYHLLKRQFLPEEPTIIQRYNLHMLTIQNAALSLERMNSLSLTTKPVKSADR